LVVIATPNKYHIEQLIAAAKNGKAVFCEKPFGMNTEEVEAGLRVIEETGVPNMVGFVYIHNPIIGYAKKIIESGELGDVVSFKGVFDMDYAADPDIPHAWRYYSSISGALGDIGTHVLSISEYLIGENQINEVCAITNTLYKERRNPNDSKGFLPVENDDQVNIIYKYKNGAVGSITASRIAPGNKVGERFELQLTKGTIRYDQERMGELEVYKISDPVEEQGFKTIHENVMHGEFSMFYPQAGLSLGYIDIMTIQAYKLLKAISEGRKIKPDAESGYNITVLTDAILKSANEHRWVKIDKCR